MTHRSRLVGLLAAIALAACGGEPETTNNPSAATPAAKPAPATQPPAADRANPKWDTFVEQQIEAHMVAHPAWAVLQGRHEFDGQLPDWSPEGLQAEAARLKTARADALAFADNSLSDRQQYQREYFVSRIDHDLFWLEKARWPYRNPQFYIGWMNDSLDPSPYITLDYAPAEERMAAFTTYLENLPDAVRYIRMNLRLPMPAPWLQLGIDAFGGYADYFENDVPDIWIGVGDDALRARFKAANAEAIEAMRGVVDWLEYGRNIADDRYALGPDLYRQMLWDTERVDIPLDELEAIGRADMARNLRALEQACAEFAPGEGIADCMARMSDRKPEAGPVVAAREQLVETRAFLVEQDLVTIPGEEEALVAEAPPYARSNSAYINIPGPWEENQPSVYYISPPNPAWSQQVQHDYLPGESDLLFTSVHEVWPGHFLNFMHANRAEWIFGRAFVSYAFGEGWAHYTEEMMLEAGLRGADAETRIGQLSNALLRDARFLASIGLHTKGWSVAEAQRFFMDEAYQSEGTAIQQAARGTYDPAYLNYTMGKLLIKRLRDDWTAERGGRQAWREFHDTFLSYGGPPIPLVRQQMMGESSPRALFPDLSAALLPPVDIEGDRHNWAWLCEDGRHVVTSEQDPGLWLILPAASYELERARSASGARYEAEGVEFWNKGREATLTMRGVSTRCVVDPQATLWEDARLRGVTMRAQGNEPPWTLELFEDRPAVLTTGYESTEHRFNASSPEDVGGFERYRGEVDGQPVEVRVGDGPCADTMADIEYQLRVEVELGNALLKGCGNSLW
ncbi:DUF885 family protein [Marinihelvus fidelis]|uniref:DUF885 family protein n=1 Tax=Marinihelvus fidelis TaxID=2613842 RepID=A0A5N0T8Y0_9GAMM|nr:DUF885 family protein [Marinihelvus fidelis]KAA9131392.1 DUF885 family protein [Marinihelvus fidelis]